jgi:hypothetical protein
VFDGALTVTVDWSKQDVDSVDGVPYDHFRDSTAKPTVVDMVAAIFEELTALMDPITQCD